MRTMTETLIWRSVAHLPDSDTTVLCWLDGGEWYAGYYDGKKWYDCTGVRMVDVVAWAEVNGPEAA